MLRKVLHITNSSLGWYWGDPHLITLDGKNFTFNGIGEYTLLQIDDGLVVFFTMQARTQMVPGMAKATSFSAVAAKETNASCVEVQAKPGGKEFSDRIFVLWDCI